MVQYLLEMVVWQKSNEGVKKHKQSKKPELFIPDFMKPKNKDPEIEEHTTEDITAILAQPRVEMT